MPEIFDTVDVIKQKRDGAKLSAEQIAWIVDAYTRGYVSDEQMAALAMAIFIRGMDRNEILQWTSAMINSGERMELSKLSKKSVDKHSTGGVGDKITLPLAPLVASFGLAVPQLSGRGLGHTGGTLDKLEAIAGWKAQLSNNQIYDILENGPGAVICAAGAGLAPADKKLYALRDVTSTVDCVPLIASSIMSKKIAEGAGVLVLDVKVGSGAFMKNLDQARVLAQTMVDLGTDAGTKTIALLTNMDTPLGLEVGNAGEVAESVEILAGGGPADVRELTLALAREMLDGAGLTDADPAKALDNGKAMDTWRKMIHAQGGDPDAPLPQAPENMVISAPTSGVLTKLDALSVGVAAWRAGAGRERPGATVSPVAGVRLHAKPGDTIQAGQPLFTIKSAEISRLERAADALRQAWEISPAGTLVNSQTLIYEKITAK